MSHTIDVNELLSKVNWLWRLKWVKKRTKKSIGDNCHSLQYNCKSDSTVSSPSYNIMISSLENKVHKIFVSRTSLDWKSKWYRQMWWFLNRHIAFFPSPNVLQFTQHNLNFWLFFENLKTVLQWICVFLESFKQIFTSLYLNFKKLHQTCPETHYQKSIKSWAYIKFVTISFSVP